MLSGGRKDQTGSGPLWQLPISIQISDSRVSFSSLANKSSRAGKIWTMNGAALRSLIRPFWPCRCWRCKPVHCHGARVCHIGSFFFQFGT